MKIILGYTFISQINAKSLKQTYNTFNLIIQFNKYKIVLCVLTIQYYRFIYITGNTPL